MNLYENGDDVADDGVNIAALGTHLKQLALVQFIRVRFCQAPNTTCTVHKLVNRRQSLITAWILNQSENQVRQTINTVIRRKEHFGNSFKAKPICTYPFFPPSALSSLSVVANAAHSLNIRIKKFPSLL